MFSGNRRRIELSLVAGYLRELRRQARGVTGAGTAPGTRRTATTRPAARAAEMPRRTRSGWGRSWPVASGEAGAAASS